MRDNAPENQPERAAADVEITDTGAPNPAAVEHIISVLTAGQNVVQGPILTENSPGVLLRRGQKLVQGIS
jgi:hypothetical protein